MTLNLNMGPAVVSGSPLAKDLCTIFQNGIDHRLTYTDTAKMVTGMVQYTNQKIAPAVIACVFKHTGMRMLQFVCSESLDFGFACVQFFGDKMGFVEYDIALRYSGIATETILHDYMRENGMPIKTADDMKRLANALNTTTCMFTNPYKDKYKCSFSLYFDPYAAFLLDIVGHKSVAPLTADEITAIVLHEIGHFVTTLARGADAYLKTELYTTSTIKFLKDASPVEKIKYAQMVLPEYRLNAPVTTKLLEQITDAYSRGSIALDVLGGIVSVVLTGIILAIGCTCHGVSMLFDMVIPPDSFSVRPGNKASDLDGLPKQVRYPEELADAYVSKHGLGNALARAVSKLGECSSRIGFGSMYLSNKACGVLYAMNAFPLLAVGLFFNGDITEENTHEKDQSRIARIARETRQVFKDAELSPSERKFYLSAYEDIRTVVRVTSDVRRAENLGIAVGKLSTYITNTPRALLSNARYKQEYAVLYANTEELIANTLFYRVAKLRSLLNR